MFNKYLLIIIGILFAICVLFYNLWDGAKSELNLVKAEKVTLEQELERRDENEKNLSKKLTELTKLYDANSDWANSPLPDSLVVWLSKSCKACK